MAYSLQQILDQAKGATELDPTDLFIATDPVRRTDCEIELHANGATLQRVEAVAKQSAPLFSMRNVTGIVEGLNLVGRKDPAQGYVHAVEGHAGYWLMSCTDLTLTGTISHVPGDWVYLGATSTGTKAAGTYEVHPCSGIVLDLQCLDAGRQGIAAVGVKNVVDEDGTILKRGLTIRATSRFVGWQRSAIDREFSGKVHVTANDVLDEGAFWQKRIDPKPPRVKPPRP